MPSTTYHLLTESEPFSEFIGGAISRWVRNNPQSVVVCPSADDTWNFPPEAVSVLPALRLYKSWRNKLCRLPWFFHRWVIQAIFRPLLKRMRPGDIMWIHNRPEFAVALTAHIHHAGGRVVLHLHNSHLVEGPARLMSQVRVDRLVFVSEFLLQQARDKFPQAGASSVLYNGADESIFYPAGDEHKKSAPVTVLFAGRLVEDKGVHVLLEAMKLLEEEAVPLQAVIVGSSNFGMGEETDYIRRLKATSPATVEFLRWWLQGQVEFRRRLPLGAASWWSVDRRSSWHRRCAGWRRARSFAPALASRAMRHFWNALPGLTRAPRCSRSRTRSRFDCVG